MLVGKKEGSAPGAVARRVDERRDDATFRPMRPSVLARRACVVVFLGALAVLGGCEEKQVVQGPEEVVQRFIAAMQGVHGDPARGEAVVGLLWGPARENLEERARRAAAASGHPVRPGEMLAPSWFSLQLTPRSYTSRIDGDWAEVTVRGDDPAQGQYRVRCVREDDAWRVALELPPLAPIRKRDDIVSAEEP